MLSISKEAGHQTGFPAAQSSIPFDRTRLALGPQKVGPPARSRITEEVKSLSKRVCKNCGAGHLRRLNRRGWTQMRLLPAFGVFPWECTMCRCRSFHRDDGHAHRLERVTALNQPF